MILRTVCLLLRVPVAQCLFTLLSNRLIHRYTIGCRFNYTGRCNLWYGKENLTVSSKCFATVNAECETDVCVLVENAYRKTVNEDTSADATAGSA